MSESTFKAGIDILIYLYKILVFTLCSLIYTGLGNMSFSVSTRKLRVNSKKPKIESISLDSDDSDFEVICDITSKIRARESKEVKFTIIKDVKKQRTTKAKSQKTSTSKKSSGRKSLTKKDLTETINKKKDKTKNEVIPMIPIKPSTEDDECLTKNPILCFDLEDNEDNEEIVEIDNIHRKKTETIPDQKQVSDLSTLNEEEKLLYEDTMNEIINELDGIPTSEQLEESVKNDDLEVQLIETKSNDGDNSLFSSPNNLLQKVGKEAWKGIMNIMQRGQKESSKGQKRNGTNLHSTPKKIKMTDYFTKKLNNKITENSISTIDGNANSNSKISSSSCSTAESKPFPIFDKTASMKVPKMFGNSSVLKEKLSELYGKGEVVELNVNEPALNVIERKRNCPFYKKLPGTSFSVDAFSYGDIPGINAYFLSHFHYDHYGGLKKTFDKTLLCSKPTANLVKLKIGVKNEYIRVLELNKVYKIENVEVVLINANHCPGSVMFIFRLPNGTNYLHTGDFRYTPDMLENEFLAGLRIDCLYLDTTYCDPKYNFPKQIDAINQVISQIKTMISFRPKTLTVCGSYSIGKERVFINLAHSISTSVYCKMDKKRIIEALEIPEFTSTISANENISQIHVLPMNNLNPAFLSDYLSKRTNLYTNIVAIKPTGWEFSSSGKGFSKKSSHNDSVTILGVPYSEHSSFSELSEFVRSLRPIKIQPTVNVGDQKKRETMMSYIDKWMNS